jgi:predicted nucleotidyltransferase
MNQEISERLRRISERLKKEYHAEKVILFGSYARGEAGEDSDVDLLVIAPTTEDFFERMARVKTIAHNLRYGLPFFPIVLNQSELEEKIRIGDQFIEEILKTGVEL